MPKNIKNYTFAVGRRKTATARVRVHSGKGESQVNGKRVAEYFIGFDAKKHYEQPLSLTSTLEKFHFTAKIEGGGKQGQLMSLIHGLSRALSKIDAEAYRPILKKQGLLTRDPRMKERRKVGTGGKARRKKQSPKR